MMLRKAEDEGKKRVEDENDESVYLDVEQTESDKNIGSLELRSVIGEAQIALNLFLNNKFELAEERMAMLADKSMYHALAHSTMLFIRAMMTCDKEDLERGMEAMRNANAVISRFRPCYSLSETIYSKLGIADYLAPKRLTTEQIHAELCYAESLMFRTILTFFYDESLSSFMCGTLKMRSCYQSFKECQRLLHNPQLWPEQTTFGSDDLLKEQFEAGVRTGIGTFNLMLSVLPPRILRLLEVVGFSGDKAVGLAELQQVTSMRNTLRYSMASLVLLSWHLLVNPYIGAEEPDLELCERLLAPLTEDYPNGTIILFFHARLCMVRGRLEEAIPLYKQSIATQHGYKHFHHACHWELLFAYTFYRDWERAAHHAKQLLDESRWSRCVYAYILAVFIHADGDEPTLDPHKKWKFRCLEEKREHTLRHLFGRIPAMRVRVAGKSIPMEKFCEKKALRYIKKGRLYYAHYEFLYFWNGFSILANASALVAAILADVESLWQRVPSDDPDDIALYDFISGVCHKVMHNKVLAERCFSKVLETGAEGLLTEFSYLEPNACFELALIALGDLNDANEMVMVEKRRSEAEALLTKALSYRSYLLETKLHFRIHAVMEKLARTCSNGAAAT